MDIDSVLKISQAISALGAILIANITLLTNRYLTVKNKLKEIQIRKLIEYREKINTSIFSIHAVASTALGTFAVTRNLASLKENQPEVWEMYQKNKLLLTDLHAKFGFSDFYGFPKSLDKRVREDYHNVLLKFMPFTMNAFVEKTEADITELLTATDKMLRQIDKILRREI